MSLDGIEWNGEQWSVSWYLYFTSYSSSLLPPYHLLLLHYSHARMYVRMYEPAGTCAQRDSTAEVEKRDLHRVLSLDVRYHMSLDIRVNICIYLSMYRVYGRCDSQPPLVPRWILSMFLNLTLNLNLKLMNHVLHVLYLRKNGWQISDPKETRVRV